MSGCICIFNNLAMANNKQGELTQKTESTSQLVLWGVNVQDICGTWCAWMTKYIFIHEVTIFKVLNKTARTKKPNQRSKKDALKDLNM